MNDSLKADSDANGEENHPRRHKWLPRNPLLRLALFGLLMAVGVSLFLWVGRDWKEWTDRLTNIHPALFLVAMSLLPVAGFPISAFYLYAGVVYGWQLGIPLCLGALAINMSLSYIVAQTLLREPLSELLKRRGHELPRLRNSANQFRATFLLRTVPGPPFSFQNYILALAAVPFAIYLPVSLVGQGAVAALVIVSSGLITNHLEPWVILVGAVVLFLLAGLIGSVFFKRKEENKEACSTSQT